MNMIYYILLIVIVLFIILFVSVCRKLKYICSCLDQILSGNLNQRIKFQNHIKLLGKLSIKINSLAEKLQKIQERNKISEESRKMIISNISHDLRTPLTSMLGYMELMLNDDALSTDKKNSYIKIIYNKGNYLYNLMEEFFQVSKLNSDDLKLDIKKLDICEIIRQNIISFFNDFKRLNIVPQLNFNKDDVYAFADERALSRILSNLINNALKYGSEGAAIGIDLTYDENTVYVSVWDDGAGIPKEEIDYVFDRLYTVEKSRKLNSKSSGLGLTIVKKLVESLNGSISVSSIPFKRTAFTFTLPRNLRKL